jgi:hypothetical protein
MLLAAMADSFNTNTKIDKATKTPMMRRLNNSQRRYGTYYALALEPNFQKIHYEGPPACGQGHFFPHVLKETFLLVNERRSNI